LCVNLKILFERRIIKATQSLKGNVLSTEPILTETVHLPGPSIKAQKSCIELTKEVISKNTFSSFHGLTGESRKTLDARLKTSGMTYKDVVCAVTNDRISEGDEKWIFSTGCKDVSTDFADATLMPLQRKQGLMNFSRWTAELPYFSSRWHFRNITLSDT
jgi:hypothetical protein